MGNQKRLKQIMFVIVVVGGYLGWTIASPYLTAYSAKPILRRACNDLIQEDIRQTEKNFKSKWENRFLSKLRAAGVGDVTEDQYNFVVTDDGRARKANYVCDGVVKFELFSPYGPIGDFLDWSKFRTVHTAKTHIEYKGR